MDTNKRIFEELPVPKAVRTMALPTVAGQLIILIYNIADTFFIGRTNDPLMVAGASLILPVFNISLSIAGIAGVGGGALISRLLGEKRPEEARKTYSFSIYFSILAAALFSVCTFIFMDPLLAALGAQGETAVFLRIRVLATPLMFLSFFHVFLFNGFGEGKHALFLGVMRWVVFNIPMLYVLNALIGMNGIVWSQVTADTFTVILSLIVYRIYENKHFKEVYQ